MRAWLTRKWRFRAASLLVVLYALCLAAPTTVMALSQAIPAHCLADDQHGLGMVHAHEDGSSHHHSGTGDDERAQPGKCCGLFSVSAIAPAFGIVVDRHSPATQQPLLIGNSLSGRDSDRIDRPPRSHLSL
jgi:hypothetical protein